MRYTNAFGWQRMHHSKFASVVVSLDEPPMKVGYEPFVKLMKYRSVSETSCSRRRIAKGLEYHRETVMTRMRWFLEEELRGTVIYYKGTALRPDRYAPCKETS